MRLNFRCHRPISRVVSKLARVCNIVRANDKASEGVEDTKRGDVNRVVRGGIYGENEGVETVALELDHEVFTGIPFATFFESVFHDEPWWAPDAAHAKRK